MAYVNERMYWKWRDMLEESKSEEVNGWGWEWWYENVYEQP